MNPQIAKALLNILGVRSGQQVLDPFCGSGTTLIECAHADVHGVGFDLNPFAVFLANAKLRALVTPVAQLNDARWRILSYYMRQSRYDHFEDSPRIAYLSSWFNPEILAAIETLRSRISAVAGSAAPVFLAVASNLLRDYPLQDPKDLRTRRRKTPLPDMPFVEAFSAACARFLERLESAQAILGENLPLCRAERKDAATLSPGADLFDVAITSPPYAMALPYVDTQRLSLVWLNQIEPSEVCRLEAELVGSREFRGGTHREMARALKENNKCLPLDQAAFCRRLHDSLNEQDGFRRQAVPALLYRYFASMHDCFRATRTVLRRGAPFALIVGHNHTVLGGIRHDIDTPAHLAALGASVGWKVEELTPLQTYRRYGYHASNAVRSETLVVLRNP